MSDKKKRLYNFLLIPVLICTVFHIFYIICNVFFSRPIWIPGYLLSFAIFWGLYMVVYGLTNAAHKTVIVLAVLLTIFGVANQLKIAYSNDPIFLGDVLFLGTAGTFTEIMKDTVGDLLLKYLWLVLLMITGFVFIYRLARKSTEKIEAIWKRILAVILPVAVIIFISLPIPQVTDSVMTIFFNTKGRQDSYATTNMGYYFKYGVFSGLYGQMIESRLVEPVGYDAEEMDQLLEAYRDAEDPGNAWGTPNIVMIFSESFWNVDDCEDITFTEPVAPTFEALKEEGILIDMVSPSYGGISANVEYEMLTGSSCKFFTPGYIPYMQLYTSDKYEKAPSVIEELRNNGYKTHVASTWDGSLFNCEKVYEYMKIDQVDYRDDMKGATNKGGRISDEYVGQRIIEELQNKPEGEKLFTMVLTAQAHMPFNSDKYETYDFDIQETALAKDEAETLLSYAQGVRDADNQLKAVYEQVMAMDEPTILIFYGDHLPYLKTEDGDDATEHMSYFHTGDELQDLYNRYHTQCLIVANFDLGPDEIDHMGPELVMTYLMSHMDLELSPYYRWLYTTTWDLPTANQYLAVDASGEKYLIGDLEGAMKEAYDVRRKMNWRCFVEVE